MNAKALYASGDHFQELLSVRIVGLDSPSLIAATGHMVPNARVLDAQGTGHEEMLPGSRRGCQIKNKALTHLLPPRQWRIIQALISSKHGKTVADLVKEENCHPRTI